MATKKSTKKQPVKKASPKRKPTKTKKKDKSFGSKILIWGVKLGLIGFLLIALFFLIVYLGFTGPVPSKEQLLEIRNPVASEVISEDGKILGRYYVQNRSRVSFNEISPHLINALIATEDSRFYEHRGIDEIALMRVLFKSILLQSRSSGGGSTLSQQIAKNLYPRRNLGPISMPVNKLRESIIAYRLERVYSKEDVLTLYLNTVPFAENTYGVEVVCERFFSKKPSEVSVSEAAAIIGMLKANNTYNPRTHPEKATQRRNTVINQMVKYGYLSNAEGEGYKEEPLKVNYRVISYNQGPAPYLVERIKPVLLDWCENNFKADGTPYNLYTDGLRIKTTINYNLQQYANYAVQEHMKNVQNVFNKHWAGREPWGNDKSVVERAIKRTEHYKRLKEQGLGEKAIRAELDKKGQRPLFSWDGIKHENVSAIDSIKHYLKLLNAGFMAMNPENGSVKAYIGGIDFRFFKYDHALAARQVGSTFKPVVYLTALEEGLEVDSYFGNEQKVYEKYNDWSPRNSHDHYDGFYSMEGALAHSINTVAVDVLMQTGIDEVIDVAKDLGINSELPEYPTLALGVASIPLQEMVCMYSSLVNGGKPIKPYFMVSIEDAKGNVLEEFVDEQEDEAVVDPENCYMITKMLQSTISVGTGKTIRTIYGINSDFAGKTGTTQNHADGWFMGMSPKLVAGAWVGGEDPAIHFRTITYGQGGYMALPIVGKFFNKAYKDPKFDDYKNAHFTSPSEKHLAMMDIPLYREIFEIDKKGFDFGKIFGKDKEEEKPVLKEKKQEEQEEKPKVWEKIKNIFRKKKK